MVTATLDLRALLRALSFYGVFASILAAGDLRADFLAVDFFGVDFFALFMEVLAGDLAGVFFGCDFFAGDLASILAGNFFGDAAGAAFKLNVLVAWTNFPCYSSRFNAAATAAAFVALLLDVTNLVIASEEAFPFMDVIALIIESLSDNFFPLIIII